MKRQVKLSVWPCIDGKILILDEPTSNLDEKAKAWFLYHHEKPRPEISVWTTNREDFKLAREVIRLRTFQ